MKVCDFARSFFIFSIDLEKKQPITVSQPPPWTKNNSRMAVICRCLVSNAKTGNNTEYLLSASCKSEQVYVEKDVWHPLNADMCMIASVNEIMTVKSWDRNNKGVMLFPESLGEQPERQPGLNADAFDSMTISVKMVEGKLLETNNEIVEAGLEFEPLVSQTEFDLKTGEHILLEYPVVCANFSRRHNSYQVDTGPVLWPDLSIEGRLFIEKLRHAFIAYNCPGWAELIVNVPTKVSEDISVNHYSKSVRIENTINRMIKVL